LATLAAMRRAHFRENPQPTLIVAAVPVPADRGVLLSAINSRNPAIDDVTSLLRVLDPPWVRVRAIPAIEKRMRWRIFDGERLPVGVADDVAGVGLVGRTKGRRQKIVPLEG
jgi:hypothetical protein